MSAIFARLLLLLVIGGGTSGLIWGTQQYLRRQGRQVMRTTQFQSATSVAASIRVLAFHTADCRQCFTMQDPALQRLETARTGQVEIIHIDAIAQPDMARQYRVMTVPTTVVLDPAGHAQAVNFGFAPTNTLLAQVDQVLAIHA